MSELNFPESYLFLTASCLDEGVNPHHLRLYRSGAPGRHRPFSLQIRIKFGVDWWVPGVENGRDPNTDRKKAAAPGGDKLCAERK
jgi:hypothetical protein